jgi:RNA polymerase sigma-70 factor (ECF subfamily)
MIFKKTTARKEFKKCTYPHMKLLYNVALKYCGNVFDAEDIVQETYLMAFHKFHQLREKSKCKPWLLKILRNNFLKNYHKQKNQKRLSEAEYVDFFKIKSDQGQCRTGSIKNCQQEYGSKSN